MSFNRFGLTETTNPKLKGIDIKYRYINQDDTLAEITASGYFASADLPCDFDCELVINATGSDGSSVFSYNPETDVVTAVGNGGLSGEGVGAALSNSTVQTLQDAVSLAGDGAVKVGSSISTIEYSLGSGFGGNDYQIIDAGSSGARPVADAGSVIYVTGGSGGLYLKGLFSDGVVGITQFGGGLGSQVGDTSAVQSIINSGFSGCYLQDNDNEYEIQGIVIPPRSSFALTGQSVKGVTIACRAQIFVSGDMVGAFSDSVGAHGNFTVKIYSDVTEGVFKFIKTRNINTLPIRFEDTTDGAAIGHAFNFDRSYQATFSGIYGDCKGFSLLEFGDSSNSEVIDTIDLGNSVWHSNSCIQQRDGATNVHGITFSNTKMRDYEHGDEHTIANNGEAYLTADAVVGATSITVSDTSQLKQGSLVANDLIYIGFGFNAEYVRLSGSPAGNVIPLDTPLRFDHSSSVNGSSPSIGEPVIFGAVHVTMQDVSSMRVGTCHAERAWKAFSLVNCSGFDINSLFSTCHKTISVARGCESMQINNVSMGNVGWGEVDLIDIMPTHNPVGVQPNVKINRPVVYEDSIVVTYVNNESTVATSSLIEYAGGTQQTVDYSFTLTRVNPLEMSDVYIDMTGDISELRILDGQVEGQRLKITFKKDSNGHRKITTINNNVSFDEPFYLSSRPFAKDELCLLWDGVSWVEQSRLVYDQAYLPREISFSDLSNAGNGINTKNKYKGKVVFNTSAGVRFIANGASANDTWSNFAGGGTIVP